MSDSSRGLGSLRFETRFHSNELSRLELPVEVRKPDLSIAASALTSQTVPLEAGQYVITTRLPAGQQFHSIAIVTAGNVTPVVLEPSSFESSPSENMEVQHFLRRSVRKKHSRAIDDFTTPYAELSSQIAAPVAVAATVNELKIRWFYGNVLDTVELASEVNYFGAANPFPIPLPSMGGEYRPLICQLEQNGSLTVNVVIPVSPGGIPPEVTILNPESTIPKYRIGVRLAHPTADLLTRYLRRGMFAEAREAITSNSMAAEQILSQKQQDPIAAVVGAYTLLRQNEIDGLHNWTGNLANWFEWLPDGAAVLGEHQARLGRHSDALTAFLLLEERGLPFFSEGLSYALERLRFYTRHEKVAEQFPADKVAAGKLLLDRLQVFATYTDFDRVALTFSGSHPTSPSRSESSQSTTHPLSSATVPDAPLGRTSISRNESMTQAAPPAMSGMEFVFNGINGATGQYLEAPMSAGMLAAMALGDSSFPMNSAAAPAQHFRDLNIKRELKGLQYYGTRFGVDMDNLQDAGWGVIFAQEADPRVAQALRPLLDLRKQQAGQYYKEYSRESGYAPNDTKEQFLRRNGMGPGPADPEKVPYYLLIVGDPETIPYEFQYQLDVQYAVGRLWFDTLDEYARYAHTVILAESGKIALPRKAVVFGPTNPDDRATALSTDQLLLPLSRTAAQKGSGSEWHVDTVIGADATRERLSRHLGGADTPALLFTASHGMGFPMGDPRQSVHQGALLCQDWPGPMAGNVDRAHYFAAEDIEDSAQLAGMIGIHFACYGAGTPRLDDFAHQSSRRPAAIAPRAFIAPLPRRMLSHPSGGALAFVGHVERAWGCSIVWQDAGRQIQAYEDAMDALMRGLPIGHALESMNQRYADISSELGAELLQIRSGTKVFDEFSVAMKWTSNNDARSYVIIGDPAVRLPLATPGLSAAIRPPAGTFVIADSTKQIFVTAPMKESEPRAEPAPAKPAREISQARERGLVAGRPANAGATISFPLQVEVRISVGDPSQDSAQSARRVAGGGGPGTGIDSFAIQIDPDYDNREGYDPTFLGRDAGKVPLPQLSDSLLEDAADVEGMRGKSRYELKYHHYSVVMNAARRLAYFAAVNIDGESAARPERETDRWSYDPRIPRESQVGNELYASNPFDRGHLVRRLDPAWGEDPEAVKQANDDTFHFTNCAPQHSRFNQGQNLWAGLEDYLLEKAADEERRMTVFTGPVFSESDPTYRDIQIPKQYWKVAVVSRPHGGLAALGFIVDQERLLHDFLSFSPDDVARTYQVPIAQIEQETGLNFGRLTQLDVGAVDSFAVPATTVRELTSFEQITLPASQPAPATAAFAATATDVSFDPAPERVDGTSFQYYLVAFNQEGRERNDHPAGLISSAVERALADSTVTDVMMISHGWQGDVPSAREQYRGWIRAMAANDADRQEIRRVRPGFKPLLVGIHWPSLEWGDEALAASFAANAIPDDAGGIAGALGERSLEAAVESCAMQLGDTPEARMKLWDALRTLLETAATANAGASTLPPAINEAYLKLDSAVGLGHTGVGGEPGSDREPFDPEAIYQAASSVLPGRPDRAVAFDGLISKERILAPLRTLTYWKMKARARKIGEDAVHPFLVRLQQLTIGRNVRFHLIGHSFGCIVVSGAIAGKHILPRPVASLTLLQGALSLWSCCDDIPYLRGTSGYYRSLINQQRVAGPIVTTRSSYDTAVGTWYPLASRVSGAVAFGAPSDAFPKYGGVGTFGFQGSGLEITDLKILDVNSRYTLVGRGAITNVDASHVICNGGGISGAHNDICKPEVAHLVWAAMTAER